MMLVRSRVRPLLAAVVAGLVCGRQRDGVVGHAGQRCSRAAGVVHPHGRAVGPGEPARDAASGRSHRGLCAAGARGPARGGVRLRQPRTDSRCLVSLEPDTTRDVDANVILRTVRVGPVRALSVEDLGPQVTLFKPGDHPHAFAVRFEPHDQVAWQVQVPSDRRVDDGGWKVTVRPRMKVRCRRNVPDHFAVVQHVDIRFRPAEHRRTKHRRSHIVAYAVAIDVANVRAACSAGGEVVDAQPGLRRLASRDQPRADRAGLPRRRSRCTGGTSTCSR